MSSIKAKDVRDVVNLNAVPTLAYNTPISNAMAADILQKAGQKSSNADSKIANAQTKNLMLAKQDAIEATKAQVSGEQKSAAMTAFGAVSGAGLNMKSASVGYSMRNTESRPGLNPKQLQQADKRRDLGNAMFTASQNGGVSNVVTSLVTLADKTSGGAYQADMAKIEGKRVDAAITVADSSQKATQALRDGSKSFFDKAVEFANGLNSAAKAAMDRISQ